jgi:DtxR family Mn-dependent transcriptional regulator
MNRAEEDYIKAVWLLHESNPDEEYVSNYSLAREVGNTAQSANEMIKKLVSKNLLIYKPYKGTALTGEGNKIATSLIRRHRLWELFLIDVLGYTWDKVHDEAEKLEHVVSPLFEEKLYNYLGSPKYCPLGYPIPALDGSFPKQRNLSLNQGMIGYKYEIVRVVDDKNFIIYLDQLNLKLLDKIAVKSIDEYSDIITIEKDGNDIHLGVKAAGNIFVKEI